MNFQDQPRSRSQSPLPNNSRSSTRSRSRSPPHSQISRELLKFHKLGKFCVRLPPRDSKSFLMERYSENHTVDTMEGNRCHIMFSDMHDDMFKTCQPVHIAYSDAKSVFGDTYPDEHWQETLKEHCQSTNQEYIQEVLDAQWTIYIYAIVDEEGMFKSLTSNFKFPQFIGAVWIWAVMQHDQYAIEIDLDVKRLHN